MFRRYILSLFASALLVLASSAQDIDSPERAINNKNIPDFHGVDTLNTLSRDLVFIDQIRAAHLASEALKTSLKINYPIGQAYAYRILSSIYSNNGLDIIATQYIQRALIIFQAYDDSAGIANCYITIGHAFRRSQNRKENYSDVKWLTADEVNVSHYEVQRSDDGINFKSIGMFRQIIVQHYKSMGIKITCHLVVLHSIE